MAFRKRVVSCPLCKHQFKLGTEKQLRMRLFTHLTLNHRHRLGREEAETLIQEVLRSC